jgi:DNA-binding Lrp family transcriptional regulator
VARTAGGLPGLGEGHLDERVLSTLQLLTGRLAFSGLRRVLGTHPESLSRALRRLEREGLVEHVDGGYRALVEPTVVEAGTDRGLRSIARIDLPPSTDAPTFLGRLTGRWFGSLRWVGLLDRPEGELLAWARRDGGELVLLGLARGVLTVYAAGGREADEPAEAEEAAYELLFHAAEALRPAAALAAPLPTVQAFVLGPELLPTPN